MAYHI